MIRRIFFAILILSITCLCSLSAAGRDTLSEADPEDTKFRISKISIHGEDALSEKEIKKKIATEVPKQLYFWNKDPVFNEEILDDDMVRIKRLYANHGYYDAKATYELKFKKKDNKVKIKIRINEGDPVMLKHRSLDFTDQIDPELIETIHSIIPLIVDKSFSPVKYQKSKGIIIGLLADNGYPKAVVKGEALVNRREKWSRVSFDIMPGELYKFGETKIQGNKKVKSYIIRREIKYEKEEIFSEKIVEDTQSNIFELGLFNSVLIDTVYNEADRSIDLIINLKERDYSNLKVGVGYGTEDFFRGQIIWIQRNFLGGGRKLKISGKFSGLTQRLENRFSQPYIAGPASELLISIKTKRDDFPSFTSESLLGSFGVRKKFNPKYELLGNFTSQFTRLVEIADSTQEFIEDNKIFLSYFSLSLARNTAGGTLTPSKGTIAQLFFDMSFKFLGSEANYVRGLVKLKGYKKLYKTVLATRLNFGVIQPLGSTGKFGIPIFKRFFSGGSNSVRGFAFHKLGPLDSGNEPIGGNTIFEGTVENRFPIWKEVSGVVFLDIGNVFPEQWEFRFNEIKYAPGFGLRYDTLIGPLRVDFAYAINPDPSLGHFQFFVNIGHAF